METKELIRRFQATFDGTPEWAWPFQPPIPLIGKQYRPGHGLLIYASAENLSWANNEPIPARFKNGDAWNRYRVRYEAEGRNSPDFFPDVGIQPVSDGGLLAAGLFISEKLHLPTHPQSRPFLEKIAVTNWCKFSIRSEKNHDYITVARKLTSSLPYVVGELAMLQPAVAMVPKQIWKHPILSAAMHGASPETKFIPIPQCNDTVSNCHLAEFSLQAQILQAQSAGTPLAKWMAEINREKTWRYMAMLDQLAYRMRPKKGLY
ncbi:MAG: hypothetical protein WC975_06095 [Phycisphaerae bacterium]